MVEGYLTKTYETEVLECYMFCISEMLVQGSNAILSLIGESGGYDVITCMTIILYLYVFRLFVKPTSDKLNQQKELFVTTLIFLYLKGVVVVNFLRFFSKYRNDKGK